MSDTRHVTKKIGTNTFVIGLIPASKAPKVAARLIKVAGPLVGEAVKLWSKAKKNAPKELDVGDDGVAVASKEASVALMDGSLEPLIRSAMELDDVAMLELMMALAAFTRVQGEKQELSFIFDNVFTGDLKSMGLWLIEAVKFNFGDFLPNMEAASE